MAAPAASVPLSVPRSEDERAAYMRAPTTPRPCRSSVPRRRRQTHRKRALPSDMRTLHCPMFMQVNSRPRRHATIMIEIDMEEEPCGRAVAATRTANHKATSPSTSMGHTHAIEHDKWLAMQATRVHGSWQIACRLRGHRAVRASAIVLPHTDLGGWGLPLGAGRPTSGLTRWWSRTESN